MPEAKVRYVGLDVHKDSIVIAVAESGRSAVREIGTVPGDWWSERPTGNGPVPVGTKGIAMDLWRWIRFCRNDFTK